MHSTLFISYFHLNYFDIYYGSFKIVTKEPKFGNYSNIMPPERNLLKQHLQNVCSILEIFTF